QSLHQCIFGYLLDLDIDRRHDIPAIDRLVLRTSYRDPDVTCRLAQHPASLLACKRRVIRTLKAYIRGILAPQADRPVSQYLVGIFPFGFGLDDKPAAILALLKDREGSYR